MVQPLGAGWGSGRVSRRQASAQASPEEGWQQHQALGRGNAVCTYAPLKAIMPETPGIEVAVFRENCAHRPLLAFKAITTLS